MFLRVTRNSVFCLASDNLDHNNFIMSSGILSFGLVKDMTYVFLVSSCQNRENWARRRKYRGCLRHLLHDIRSSFPIFSSTKMMCSCLLCWCSCIKANFVVSCLWSWSISWWWYISQYSSQQRWCAGWHLCCFWSRRDEGCLENMYQKIPSCFQNCSMHILLYAIFQRGSIQPFAKQRLWLGHDSSTLFLFLTSS